MESSIRIPRHSALRWTRKDGVVGKKQVSDLYQAREEKCRSTVSRRAITQVSAVFFLSGNTVTFGEQYFPDNGLEMYSLRIFWKARKKKCISSSREEYCNTLSPAGRVLCAVSELDLNSSSWSKYWVIQLYRTITPRFGMHLKCI